MAGLRFVQELLELDAGAGFAVAVIGDEPGGAYNRIQLPNVLAGAVLAESIELADENWYAARGVRLLAGEAVVAIDPRSRLVRLAGGTAVPYDVLVLATGSSAVLPPAAGLTRPDGRLVAGAVAFRTLADCAEIETLATRASSAVVLGGGVLGLETARGLAGLGLPVTVVQRGPRLMERQLDVGASRVLARTVRSVGVRVRTGASVSAIRADDQVRAVELDDGSALETDLLVLCCGTRPRAELARSAGLAVGAGVIVDDRLRSVDDPSIFAIGECTEHRGRTHGLLAPCWEQARVAAHVIGCHPGSPARYTGSRGVLRLKAAGIELATMGSAGAGAGAEVITFADPARGVYQKLVVRDGRLAGAILLGDTRTAGTVTQLFDRGAALPADRSSLLLVRRNVPATVADSPGKLPGQATICQCNGVTKAAICAAWQDGARDASEVATRTRATTGCGTCRDAVRGIVEWLAVDADLVPA
jgi:assimilatory nitrate reductase electron transfer subunit